MLYNPHPNFKKGDSGHKKTKDLANLMNVNPKHTGSGGSTPIPTQTAPLSPPKSISPSPSLPFQASSPLTSTSPPTQVPRRVHPLPQVLRAR